MRHPLAANVNMSDDSGKFISTRIMKLPLKREYQTMQSLQAIESAEEQNSQSTLDHITKKAEKGGATEASTGRDGKPGSI